MEGKRHSIYCKAKKFSPISFFNIGIWRSLVARILGVDEVVGSNPAMPTTIA